MPAHILDGTAVAAALSEEVRLETARLRSSTGITATLAVVLVGDNPASQVYVRSKSKKAEAIGITAVDHRLPAQTSQDDLLALIARLDADKSVHGILVQLPLPAHIAPEAVLGAIAPAKDVDGFHPLNVGLLASGNRTSGFTPCTPLGCLFLLQEWYVDLAGLNAVVLGRSTIVGRPMAHLLLQGNCTVTMAHSQTENLGEHCRRADIVIAAVGKPNFVTADLIRPGATVIDVGINRVKRADGTSALVGDVAYGEVSKVAGAITPVPGGVGPMTIACLLANTVISAYRHAGLAPPQWIAAGRLRDAQQRATRRIAYV